tara:strand:+ start:466 stop:1665 length:1200 start_codon:yes stop_codon:yes gene_type:complete
MALFSLTDINFNPGGNRTNLFKSDFGQDNLRYPSDLGDIGKGHYMVFYVNVQKRTQFKDFTPSTRTPATISNRTNDVSNLLNGVYDSVVGSTARSASSEGDQASPANFIGDAKNYLTGALSNGGLFRSIVSTTDSIALYMPDTLNFTYNQNYDSPSMSAEFGNVGAAAQGAAAGVDAVKNFINSGKQFSIQNLAPFVSSLTPFAAKAVTQGLGAVKLGGGAGTFAALTNLSGGVLSENPQLELIYSSPVMREFRYSFMFYPRDERESTQVLNIIDKFKFHQAPEILGGTLGRFLVPPSEFDIEFHYNGKVNPNLPRVSTCVLTSIDIDYAPNGFAAYESGKTNQATRGSTGMPVGIRMDLAFKEIDIITKQFFKKPNSRSEPFDTSQEVNINQPAGGGV